MGLFSKKKAIEFSPKQAPVDPGMPDLNQLLFEAPVPPPELQQLNLPFPKELGSEHFPLPPGFQNPFFSEPQGLHIPPPPGSSPAKPLPAFEGAGSVPTQFAQQPAKSDTESFELPDFDEEDLKDIEEAERAPKKMMSEEETPSYSAVEVKSEASEPEEDEAQLEYPESTLEKTATGKDKYLEINRCFEAKETVEELRKISKSTEDGIENHSAKETNEKYHSLLNTLNVMQEKFIIIDNKLFE